MNIKEMKKRIIRCEVEMASTYVELQFVMERLNDAFEAADNSLFKTYSRQLAKDASHFRAEAMEREDLICDLNLADSEAADGYVKKALGAAA